MMTWNSMFFLSPSSYMMEMVISMHDYVMMFLFTTLFLVFVNMSYSLFCQSFNLNFFESHQLESVWTVGPFFLLILVAIPSLNFLYMLDACSFCGLSVSIMGHQWYWSYIYKDFKNFFFDSYMDTSHCNFMRLIEVDNRLILPSFVPIRFLVSSSDVIHSWAVPAYGIKLDAIPGRISQFCTSSKRTGVFFGQCSEICGANHSFMPIVLEMVHYKDFFSMI